MSKQDLITNLELEKIKLLIQRKSRKEYIILGSIFSFMLGLVLSIVNLSGVIISKFYSNNISLFLILIIGISFIIVLFIHFYYREDEIFEDIENDINKLIKKVKGGG